MKFPDLDPFLPDFFHVLSYSEYFWFNSQIRFFMPVRKEATWNNGKRFLFYACNIFLFIRGSSIRGQSLAYSFLPQLIVLEAWHPLEKWDTRIGHKEFVCVMFECVTSRLVKEYFLIVFNSRLASNWLISGEISIVVFFMHIFLMISKG